MTKLTDLGVDESFIGTEMRAARQISPYKAAISSGVLPAIANSSSVSDTSKFGIWLDDRIVINGDKADEFVLTLIEMIEPFELRKRKRRRNDIDSHYRRIMCIVANALRAYHYRDSPKVAYNRTAGAYSQRAAWFSPKTLGKSIQAMVSAGLLAEQSGRWSGFTSSFEGCSSTFWALQSLLELAAEFGVSGAAITVAAEPDRPVVRLRGPKDEFGRAEELGFEPNPEIKGWVDKLVEWNLAAYEADIRLDLSQSAQSKLLAKWNANLTNCREPRLTRLELYDTALVRIFNDGSFDRGGRMYGGWWQQIPSTLRSAIVIDGEETIELDYSGMSVRMLYHLHDINYLDDPYSLKELENFAIEQGYSADHYRPAVKQFLAAMLNGNCETHFEKVPLSRSFGPKFKRREVQAMIERKHQLIASEFHNGIGLWLQRLDSNIALDVITELLSNGILALPVHDSFIVKKQHSKELRTEMISAYLSEIGSVPVIH